MQEKLETLYNNCISEMNSIGIKVDLENIHLKISSRSTKRYGCCKHYNPIESSKYVERKGYKRYIKYNRFALHDIEISNWVLNLDDEIIKNTIIHEIIHTFTDCDNHGKTFKQYANYINQKLGYNISRVGNKKEDFEKSGINYEEENKYKYLIKCKKCGQEFYRKRFNKNLLIRYRCGKCGGKLEKVS